MEVMDIGNKDGKLLWGGLSYSLWFHTIGV
jgi:hypothetical protein